MARPKRVFTDEQIQEMESYALEGGQNNTIATVMSIPLTTLIRRFGKLLTKKRAERKLFLRRTQTLLAVTNPAMAIFLGKNELKQTDKQVIEQITPVQELTEAERKVVDELAREYKIRLARGLEQPDVRPEANTDNVQDWETRYKQGQR